MFWEKNKQVITLIALMFTFSVAAGFFWGSKFMNPSEREPAANFHSPADFFNPKVSPETMLIKDKEYLCGDLEKLSEEIVPVELRGIDRKTLVDRFPPSEGWIVNFNDPKFLTVTEKVNEFCPIHRSYRHLGLYHELLAVYEGPLGFKGKVLRVENISVESLNSDFRIKLEQAMDFDKQSRSAVEKLREVLEFSSEEALNAALENLDEHS